MAEERKDLELEAEEARASREADASVQPEADAGEPEAKDLQKCIGLVLCGPSTAGHRHL